MVAVIVATPGLMAVTAPAPPTVATAVLLEPQATGRPVTTLPWASTAAAVSWRFWVIRREPLGGVMLTAATGPGVTVAIDDPDFPSAVAVIMANPGWTPVTTPLAETVATAASELAQLTGRLKGEPLASKG